MLQRDSVENKMAEQFYSEQSATDFRMALTSIRSISNTQTEHNSHSFKIFMKHLSYIDGRVENGHINKQKMALLKNLASDDGADAQINYNVRDFEVMQLKANI